MPSQTWVVVGFLLLVGLAAQSVEPASSELHPVEIRNPPLLGKVDSGLRDASGVAIGIECATCHGPSGSAALASEGDESIHGEIALAHGALACASCHDPTDRTRLRLADGQAIPFAEVMTLCGQCHGPVLRSFEHGAHGGGRGHWDRSRGPFVRNNCVACHDAHQPAYPLVSPAPGPNDRFQPAAQNGAPGRHGAEEASEHE
ncbi:MAG: hypothetical protein QNK05_01255 [Myxococcota bacterium]|nr:hypothetical protein [Myxococcota bacterium]